MTIEGRNIRRDGENIRIWRETKAKLDRMALSAHQKARVALGQKIAPVQGNAQADPGTEKSPRPCCAKSPPPAFPRRSIQPSRLSGTCATLTPNFTPY